jgi:hypothetical protein
MKNYKFNDKKEIRFKSSKGISTKVEIQIFKDALKDTHDVIDTILKDIPVDIFEILGMRNLSAFIGELYVKSFERISDGEYLSNPHQDGYPDLLLMDTNGRDIFNELKNLGESFSKAPFSPFENGGIEVKATVGSVPTPAQCAKKGLTKPQLGDTRIHLMKSYDWKAHHRETNNLLGIIWDFINGIPRITAIFFSPNLNKEDWSAIVTPKEGGGRTTSVSIMKRHGVRKMYDNWICVLEDENYINFLNKYNKGTAL